MSRHRTASLIIDARPRGMSGRPLARERVLGRPVLAQLVELAADLGTGPVTIHARAEEHPDLRRLLAESGAPDGVGLAHGPPPEGAVVLRTDRLYDPSRLRRALARGRDPEAAVIWRLDDPTALAGAADELLRRRTYQPLGRFWALGPARWLARRLRGTRVRPNALTLASGLLVLAASGLVAAGGPDPAARIAAALALALALVIDTADGHLARLQGTASAFGRWLDSNLDELGDMALHAAVAWALFARDRHPAWLLVGMLYGMGKYVFFVGVQTWSAPPSRPATVGIPPLPDSWPRRLAHWAGHADVRWHLWIVLAALGRLDVELVAFAAYYPARALAGAIRKANGHA